MYSEAHDNNTCSFNSRILRQHSIPVAKLDKVISEFADKGLPIISTFNTPIAKIVFFDTYKEIDVMTEIMGITKEGGEQVQNMKK